jgi:DNA-binding IclR family transcriptional regulator
MRMQPIDSRAKMPAVFRAVQFFRAQAMTINVLEKTFAVLEQMADVGTPVPLKKLTELTGLPKGTTFRILQTLLKLGYVEQDGKNSEYYLTPNLLHLGRSVHYGYFKELALPMMDSLYAEFNETVNLGVLQGLNVYYVHVLETTRALRWQVKPELKDAFFTTALGRSIVAYLPADETDALTSRVTYKKRTPNTISSERELKKELLLTRKRGWAFDNEENDLGVVCIGVPILREGRPIAGISLSIPKSRLSPSLKRAITRSLVRTVRRDGTGG